MGMGYKLVLVLVAFMGLGLIAAASQGGNTNARSTLPDEHPDNPGGTMVTSDRLFSDIEVAGSMISPDGKNLAFASPVVGVYNLFVGEISPEAKARQLTFSERVVRRYHWAWNGDQIVYYLDKAGDERYQFFAVDIHSGETIELTPEFSTEGYRVAAWGEGFFMSNNMDPSCPDEVIVLTDELEQDRKDVWRVNIATGDRELVQTGLPDAQRWLVDNSLSVRGYLRGEDNGATSLWLRDTDTDNFTERLRFAVGDMTHYLPIEFSADNSAIYLLDATGRDTKALVKYDLTSLEREIVSADDGVDAQGFTFHPRRHEVISVQYYRGRLEREVLDSDYAALLDVVCSHKDEDVFLAPAHETGRTIAYYSSSSSQPSILLMDTTAGNSYELGLEQTVEPDTHYCEMQPIQLEARDGLTLHGYLTLPHEFEQPGPLVLLVHGGPDPATIGTSTRKSRNWLAGAMPVYRSIIAGPPDMAKASRRRVTHRQGLQCRTTCLTQ